MKKKLATLILSITTISNLVGGIVYAEEINFNSKGKLVYEGTTIFDSADLIRLKNSLASTQASLEARIEQNTADIDTLNTNLSTTKTELAESIAKNTTNIIALTNKLDSTKTELEQKISQNTTDITTINDTLSSINSKITTSNGDISSLSEKIEKNTTDITTINTTLSSYKAGAKQDVANNLTTTASGSVLDARQGKVLNDKITTISDSLNTELTELKKSVSDGKSAIASAITAKGVSTASDATFETIVTNIKSLADNQYNAGYNAGVSASSINNAGSVFSETLGSGHNKSCSGSKTINSGSYKALVFIFAISLEDKSINSYSVNFSKGTQLYSGSMSDSKVYVLKCDTNTSITVNYNFQYSNEDSDLCFLNVIGIK